MTNVTKLPWPAPAVVAANHLNDRSDASLAYSGWNDSAMALHILQTERGDDEMPQDALDSLGRAVLALQVLTCRYTNDDPEAMRQVVLERIKARKEGNR